MGISCNGDYTTTTTLVKSLDNWKGNNIEAEKDGSMSQLSCPERCVHRSTAARAGNGLKQGESYSPRASFTPRRMRCTRKARLPKGRRIISRQVRVSNHQNSPVSGADTY